LRAAGTAGGHELEYLTIHGHRRAFVRTGSGPALLLLHGLGADHTTWEPVIDQLARRFTVIAPDLLGHGQSAKPRADYSVGGYANGMRDLLTVLGIDKVNVVGHSFGGGVAMWLLLYRPDAIRRLALIAPGGLGREVAIELRLAALPFVVERYGQPWMGLVMRLLARLNGRSLSPDARNHLLRVSASPGTARAFARTVGDVIGWRGQTRSFLERAEEIQTLPAMALFWGEKDRIIPIGQGEALCATLENCTLERFPGAGHFLHWERPRELAEALLRFVEAPVVLPARLGSSSALRS